MKLFITGSEGFIGRALKARCRKDGIEYVGIDIVDGIDICGVIAPQIPEGATIVHLAAVSTDFACFSDPTVAFHFNVTGTVNIAAAAERRNVAQFIFASSEWVHEKDSIYGLTKSVAEQYLRLTWLNTTILRFGIVYGPGGNSAIDTLRDGAVIGSAATARRFIHVEDIVSGILASVGRTGYEIFDLTGERLITLGEVAELLGVKVTERNHSAPSIRDHEVNLLPNWKPKIGLKEGLCTLTR